MRLYVGLVHYPVYNRNRQRIASAITTLDLHDIARLARTYDIRRFFVITPLEDQQRLAELLEAANQAYVNAVQAAQTRLDLAREIVVNRMFGREK